MTYNLFISSCDFGWKINDLVPVIQWIHTRDVCWWWHQLHNYFII